MVSSELKDLLLLEHQEVNNWGRHIMQLYYTWFTAFVQVTVLAQAWLFAKEITLKHLDCPAKAVFFCFIASDILGFIAATFLSRYIGKASNRIDEINKLLVHADEVTTVRSAVPVASATMGFVSCRIGLACFAAVWIIILVFKWR